VCVFVCTECPRGRWGVGCQQVCQCHHSSGCDPVSGECLCLPGWFGRTCSQGIYTQHADRLTDSFYNHQEHTNKQSELCTKQVIAPGAARRYAPADGSSTRGGSTSVRGRVRSPHISGGRPWLSCRRPACLWPMAAERLGQLQPGTDRRTGGSR